MPYCCACTKLTMALASDRASGSPAAVPATFLRIDESPACYSGDWAAYPFRCNGVCPNVGGALQEALCESKHRIPSEGTLNGSQSLWRVAKAEETSSSSSRLSAGPYRRDFGMSLNLGALDFFNGRQFHSSALNDSSFSHARHSRLPSFLGRLLRSV